jgi:hypothetical protein
MTDLYRHAREGSLQICASFIQSAMIPCSLPGLIHGCAEVPCSGQTQESPNFGRTNLLSSYAAPFQMPVLPTQKLFYFAACQQFMSVVSFQAFSARGFHDNADRLVTPALYCCDSSDAHRGARRQLTGPSMQRSSIRRALRFQAP